FRVYSTAWSWLEPATSVMAMALKPLSFDTIEALGKVSLWIHVLIMFVFLNFLPLGKHFHVLVGLPNVFLKALPPLPRVSTSAKLSTPNLEREEFGAKTFKDLTWKQALDVNTCTECGRCQTHCPTYLTQKPLTHKEVNQS